MNKWLNAQTFSERLEALRFSGRSAGHAAKIDSDVASRRLAHWKSHPALPKESSFNGLLSVFDCTEEELFSVLGAEAGDLYPPSYEPEWMKDILRIEEAFVPHQSRRTPEGLLNASLALAENAVASLHRFTLDNTSPSLREEIERIEQQLATSLFRRLIFFSQRALALEINILSLTKSLEGETPEARFKTFCDRMNDSKNRLSFYEKYPVLARNLHTACKFWLSANRDFIGRYAADRISFPERFGIAAGDKLQEVQAGSGDVHAEGRSVYSLKFESGKKLIYKPHSLAVDEHFQALLEWTNQNAPGPQLKTLSVLNREDYGWVEFVPHAHCQDDDELKAFYRKQGTLLALFHALAATDMHFENVVANGADPVAIDLETLFHADTTELTPKNATEAVFSEVRDSVMAIGILPTPVLNAKNEVYDTSGFGGNAGQQTPYSVLSLQNLGKDDLRFGHAPATIKDTHNQPRANINRQLASASLLKGFEESCSAFLELKQQLLSQEGPIEAFARDKVRLVIRPTSTYGTLLVDSTHPDFLKNELDRTRHWLQLFAALPYRPELLKFIRSEINQLSVGDIPYFAFVPDSRLVSGGDGSEIKDGLTQTGLETVRSRILGMTPEAIQRQTWFIRSSLGYTEGYYRGPSPSSSTPLEMATEAGNDVLRNLIVNGEMATVLNIACLSSDPESDLLHFAIQPAGDGLYDGTGGYALFLAYLANQTGEPKFKAAAEKLLNHILKADEMRSRHSISAFSGRAARIYLLTHLGVLWNRAGLLDEAEKSLEGLPEMIDKDRVFDIITGTAGCLLAVLALAEARPEGPAGKVAEHAGMHLLKVFDEGKRSWELAPFQRGFSHGASGISYALARLHEASGDKRFLRGALDAAQWEDALIQGEHWTDRHHTNGHHQVSWCHGAPGIALARLALPESETLQKALEICRREPSGPSQCLCHGTLGNIEPLLHTNQLDERSRFELFEKVASGLRQHGWRSTLANQTLSDGLLTGVSGIGYGLLRLANADQIPSVLTLEGVQKVRRWR